MLGVFCLLLLLTTVCGSNSSADATSEFPNLKLVAVANCNGELLLNVSWDTNNNNPCETRHYDLNHTSGESSSKMTREMAWSSTRPFILKSTSDSDVQHCVQLRCLGKETWSQKLCTLDPPKELYVACEKNHELQLKCMNESALLSDGSSVIWRHNGTEVSDGVDNSGNISVLRIPNTTWTDGGRYSCVSEREMTIRSYSVIIGIPPRGQSLECHGHNYSLVTCAWNSPETNLPTNVMCTYAKRTGLGNIGEYILCDSSRGVLYLRAKIEFTEFSIKVLTRNALGQMSDPENPPLVFNVGEDTKPLPPDFRLSVTRISATEQQLRITWNYSLPLTYETYSDIKWERRGTYVDVKKKPIKCPHEQNCKRYNLPYGNVEYCVRMMVRTLVMMAPGIWSEELCLPAPPNRPNVEIQVPSCASFSTDDCGYIIEDKSRRDANISWKVDSWEENNFEPPQGVTGFNLSIERVTDSGAQYDRAIFYNMTESDPRYPYNKTFHHIVPGLLVDAAYTVRLSAFNLAGSTRAQEFTIPRMKIIETNRQRVDIRFVSLIIPVLLVIVALVPCVKEYHKQNSHDIPEPFFPAEFRACQMVRREREVFDTLLCHTTSQEQRQSVDKPQSNLVFCRMEGSPLLDSNNQSYVGNCTSCDWEDTPVAPFPSSTHVGGKDSSYQQLYSIQGLSLRTNASGDEPELRCEKNVVRESTIDVKSANNESAPCSNPAMPHAVPKASPQGYVANHGDTEVAPLTNQTSQGYIRSPSWRKEDGVAVPGASPYWPKDPD